MKVIYTTIDQSGTSVPTHRTAFGDSYLSLGFAAADDLPARDGVGIYRLMTGDELPGPGSGNINLQGTILDGPCDDIRVKQIDTMQIEIRTFIGGSPADLNGAADIQLVLNVAE